MIGGRQPNVGLSRRSLLAGLCLTPLPAWSGSPPPRVAALDWGIAATMLAIGVTPIAVPARNWYEKIVVTPALPPEVADAGLLNTPSFEFLQQLRPDRIVIAPNLMPAEAFLSRIAPVDMIRLSFPAGHDFSGMEAETRRLASLLGAGPAAQFLLDRVASAFTTSRSVIAGQDAILVLGEVDERHVLVQGGGSLFHLILDRLGLRNAGLAFAPQAPSAIIGIERLTESPDATLLCIDAPDRDASDDRFVDSPFWRALPAVRKERFHRMPSVFGAGGLPAVERFLALLPAALARSGRGLD